MRYEIMPYEFYPLFFFLALLLGCWCLVLGGRALKERSRLREREMIHRERIEAMQHNLPVPPVAEPDVVGPRAKEASPGVVQWFRTVSLAIGLFFFFTGAGMCISFWLVSDFREIWSVGMIPAMAGVGFLLFFAMSRDLATGGHAKSG
jgi:hypothetical protein